MSKHTCNMAPGTNEVRSSWRSTLPSQICNSDAEDVNSIISIQNNYEFEREHRPKGKGRKQRGGVKKAIKDYPRFLSRERKDMNECHQ